MLVEAEVENVVPGGAVVRVAPTAERTEPGADLSVDEFEDSTDRLCLPDSKSRGSSWASGRRFCRWTIGTVQRTKSRR